MNFKEGSPQASEVTMTQLVLPSHTNNLDTVFGGTIMSWVDIAAAICAGRHCKKDVVTASIDALHFLAPIYVGWVVEVKARVNYVSNRSLEIGVVVDGFEPRTNVRHHTASALLTFVALNEDKTPAQVPKLILSSEEDKKICEEALKRKAYRLEQKKTLLENRSK